MHIISRSIEEKVEEYYKTKFDEYEIRHIGKTKSINSDISNTLSESESKSGGKGDNYPDIQLLLEDNYSRRIPVMIEAKGGKNKLEKLDKNGQIVQETVFASDSKPYVKNPIKKVIRIIQLLLLMLQMGHYIMVEVNPLRKLLNIKINLLSGLKNYFQYSLVLSQSKCFYSVKLLKIINQEFFFNFSNKRNRLLYKYL